MANKLRFGTGGMPLTSKSRTAKDGITRIHELGLEHMELEFVYQVFVKKEDTEEIKKLAEQKNVTLSVHGSYFVNLAADDKQKWHAGISRVIQAAERGDECGAISVTYHSGFIQDKPHDQVFQQVKEGTKEILDGCKKKNLKIHISPELTGKASQFGDVEDLVQLTKELRAEGYGEQIGLCIDFAHKYARSVGEYNSYDQFVQVLETIGKGLGESALHDLHIHMSAIEHGQKGEKNHLLYLESLKQYADAGIEVEGIDKYWEELDAKRFEKNKFDWQAVFKALKKMDVKGYVVCESPLLELDALLMSQYYHQL